MLKIRPVTEETNMVDAKLTVVVGKPLMWTRSLYLVVSIKLRVIRVSIPNSINPTVARTNEDVRIGVPRGCGVSNQVSFMHQACVIRFT